MFLYKLVATNFSEVQKLASLHLTFDYSWILEDLTYGIHKLDLIRFKQISTLNHCLSEDSTYGLHGIHKLDLRTSKQISTLESLSFRWIAAKPMLFKRFDVIPHEAKLVAPQMMEIIPWINSSFMQVIKDYPERVSTTL